MIVHRKIKIKVIVTEDFKNAVIKDIQQGLQQLEAEISFIEQRIRKTLTELTIKASPQAQAVREQLDYEKKKREEARTELLEQMKKVGALAEGSEVLQGEVAGPVEVNVGDKWDEIFDKEIVLRDGVVVEIRQGAVCNEQIYKNRADRQYSRLPGRSKDLPAD